MLQWMGGSRRKVATTRKSTYSRQKQYFEQKKRKWQTSIPQYNAEETKSISCNGGSRSLDILSLANLATVSQAAQHGRCTQSTKTNVAPVMSHEAKCLPPSSSSNHWRQYDANFQEASRLPNSEHDAQPEQLSCVTAISDGNILKCLEKNGDTFAEQKIDVSCAYNSFHKTGTKVVEHPKGTQNNLSLLDILNDDESNSNFEGRIACEDHVAFSIEGFGRIGTHTPTKTPRKTGSGARFSPLRVDFCKSSFSKSASILDDFREYKEIGIYPHERLDNICPVRQGCFNSINALPFDTRTCSQHRYQTEKDHSVRSSPRPKRRMSNDSWESELHDGWYDQAIPEVDGVPLCFDRERHSQENWVSCFEDVIDRPVWSFPEHGNMVDNTMFLSDESSLSPEAREGTDSSWFGSVNLCNNKLRNDNKDFNSMFNLGKNSANMRTSMNMDELLHNKNLAELGCSWPMKVNWDSGERCSEKPTAFKQISRTNDLFQSTNGHATFDAYSMQDSLFRTTRKDYEFFGNESSEDISFDVFEDSVLHPIEGWTDKKPVRKAVIDDGPFGKSYPGIGNIKEQHLFNQSKNPLFPLGEENECHISSCSEDQLRDAQSTEMLMRPNIAKGSSNESNLLSSSCRETSIADNNKSSVEDNASSSKLAPITAPHTGGSKHEVETTETPDLHDDKCSENPPKQTGTANDLEQLSPKLKHTVCNNLQEGSDAGAVAPIQCVNGVSGKENSNTHNSHAEGVNVAGYAGNSSCQVMLQTYVLQILCVQKVLMNSSVRDPDQNG